ncbi:TPA: hypothetical protein ACP32N_005075 [Pseudomonas aeruginosa]
MGLWLELGDVIDHSGNPLAGCAALIGALAVGLTSLADFTKQLRRVIQVLLGLVGVLNEPMMSLFRLAMSPGHHLDDFEQARGANFIGISQAVAVAHLLSALAIVGQCFRATDPTAESALGGIVAPNQRFLPNAGWYAFVLFNVAHGTFPR